MPVVVIVIPRAMMAMASNASQAGPWQWSASLFFWLEALRRNVPCLRMGICVTTPQSHIKYHGSSVGFFLKVSFPGCSCLARPSSSSFALPARSWAAWLALIGVRLPHSLIVFFVQGLVCYGSQDLCGDDCPSLIPLQMPSSRFATQWGFSKYSVDLTRLKTQCWTWCFRNPRISSK